MVKNATRTSAFNKTSSEILQMPHVGKRSTSKIRRHGRTAILASCPHKRGLEMSTLNRAPGTEGRPKVDEKMEDLYKTAQPVVINSCFKHSFYLVLCKAVQTLASPSSPPSPTIWACA